MSLRNSNHLMSSMLSRASGISFDPVIPSNRPQFNPATGSWVFGLAAFAAGVAVNKMIKPDAQRSTQKTKAPRSNPRASTESFEESHMRSLLRDTMAEESRSGEYVETISAEVARLRDEIASLSAQRSEFSAVASAPDQPDVRLEQEFNQVRETLERIHEEKKKLSNTEQELKQVLASQTNKSPYSQFAATKLDGIQQELHRLKDEQQRIQAEYEFSRDDASKAHQEMDRLQQQLQDKISKLHEAEVREQSLKRDYQVLMETVESLKTQLDFFRYKASQDQSGVTSLKILEESNTKLNDQVSSSLYQAEQQQAALVRLAAEKSDLAKQLEEYKNQAQRSEERMTSLEEALSEAKNTEKALLDEVETLSKQQIESASDAQERAKLENELNSARVNIQLLESKEQELLNKLQEAEKAISNSDELPIVNQLTSERDDLQRALASSDRNIKDLEASYKEQLTHATKSSGDAKTELVIAAEKEEELNHQIIDLEGKVKTLEDEKNFLKSQSERMNLKATNAGNEFMSLMKSIHTLESEKRSLSIELDRFKNDASTAQHKLTETQRKLDLSLNEEKKYSDQITSIKSSISNHQQLSADFQTQQRELEAAQQHIEGLIKSHQSKDKELDDARHDLNALKDQLVQLGQRSNQLEGSEREAVAKVSMIQEELSHKDQIIANSKIQEDALKREVDILRQTSSSMDSEIKRLNEMQASLGSNSASLELLKDTEQQLRDQIKHATQEIEKQHGQLVDAEYAKTLLENNQREESLRLSAIQSENYALKLKLQELEQLEQNKQNLVSEIDRDEAYFKSLERESELLKQRQYELQHQVEQSRESENQLKAELQSTQDELASVIQQRDAIKQELDAVRQELEVVSKEKNGLQETCSGLQATIQDLEAKKNKTTRFAKTIAQDKVIPLTQKDAVVTNQTSQYEELDTTVFDDSIMKTEEFTSPVSEQLFQSTKTNARLRKFKGHRKIEDIAAKENDLDTKIKENLELSQAQEMDGIKDESVDSEDKKKAYSPNRSFSDLLEESERRKVETKPQDPEKQWNELDAQLDEDFIDEEKSSLKPLLYGSLAAGLLIGAPLTYLYYSPMDANNTGDMQDMIADSAGNSSGVGANATSNDNNNFNDNASIGGGEIDLESPALNQKVLGLLQKFHQAKDFESKAKLCRLPNRTLKHMKLYAATNTQDHTVEKVELQPKTMKKNGLTFIVAAVEGMLDGETFTKDAYFVKNDKGELELDWHNYVNYESAPWDKFLNFDDNKNSQDWHVILSPEDNDHDDFPEDKFGCFKVSSWNPDSYGSAYAYLRKDDPMYEQLIDTYKNDRQRKFILRLRHTGDGSLALLVDEVVSLSEFYLSDIDSTVSSSIDEISFGDSSY